MTNIRSSYADARKRVCRACHMVMDDGEPFDKRGDFFHKTVHKDGTSSKCRHAGKIFHADDPDVAPFMRKARRRALMRGTRRIRENQDMGWASAYIEKLQAGETVEFNPRGSSMVPKIRSGQRCTVIPVTAELELNKNDIVLCRVDGKEYLHLIKAVQLGRYQIGNNRGHINGWVTRSGIFGKLVGLGP